MKKEERSHLPQASPDQLHLMLEMMHGFGSVFINSLKHIEVHWTSLYLSLLEPLSWMAAGYFACYLSCPKPVTSFDLASTNVPRHLRRITKGMRRKQKKMERDWSQACRTKYKRKSAKSTFGKPQATKQRTSKSFLSPSEEVSQLAKLCLG